MKRAVSCVLLLAFASNAFAGLTFVRSNGITLTGADGITLTGADGITLTGADGLLPYRTNGITLTGADGITLTGADSITRTAADGATYTGSNGITLTGADGITLTGADGITLTGADGITLTGADGTTYTANSITIRRPNGITLTGADGITLTGADGITLTGADGVSSASANSVAIARSNGITLTGADGITLTGADGITLTGADGFTGFGPAGVLFENNDPSGITLTGADGITLTGADGITLTGADGITLTGADARLIAGLNEGVGIQGLDPDLAVTLNSMTDDSNVNAIIAYHSTVTDADIATLHGLGINGGTRMRRLPIVYVTATRNQLVNVSRLAKVRSIYGNKTLNFNADPYFNGTGIQRVQNDNDLRIANGGMPVSGRDVTVAVLDTGINALHSDLAGKVVQNVRLADLQSVPAGFTYPIPTENLANTDLAGGHGTFVAGIIAGNGAASGGRYAGVASGARLLGLSAGDINLISVLSGFDYLLEKGAQYNVRAVNCSFSAATHFDLNDPVNIATKMLTASGISVIFSAGNTGPGSGTLNPYAAAPWVIGVGATDDRSRLADFSSRGDFADQLQHPLVVAPGVNVIGPRSIPTTTSVGGVIGGETQRLSPLELPYYTTATGTSFSAPQVAGAVALMLDANPNLSPADIRDIIGRTASPLPKYFYHEAGAGMLNTYAAVLEAAFPERRMGAFRSLYSKNSIRFVTSDAGGFVQSVFPYAAATNGVSLPADTVQAGITIAWNLSANDFGLTVLDNNGSVLGTSNNINLPGVTGRTERVVLRDPSVQGVRAEIRNSLGIGTMQNVTGSVKVTRVLYPDLVDLNGLPQAALADIRSSLLSSVMLPEGRRFGPQNAVLRSELADVFVRSGLVAQYIAGSQMYSDVRDRSMRGAVESVQSNPDGRLFVDATTGGRFYPYSNVSKLIAAIAYVRAAKLDSAAASTTLPTTLADASSIPVSLRGYVAVALQRGFIKTDGNLFAPNRPITRVELATAMNRLVGGDY